MDGLANISDTVTTADLPVPAHPTQPLVQRKTGPARFRSNALVVALLKHHPQMSCLKALKEHGSLSQDDLEQVAQPIGLSLAEARKHGYAQEVDAAAVEAKGLFRKAHPFQPLVDLPDDLTRFKANAVVSHLLETGPLDMNALAVLGANKRDHEKFAQLIGYSFRGASELSYFSDGVLEAVEADLALRLVQERQRRLESAIAPTSLSTRAPRL